MGLFLAVDPAVWTALGVVGAAAFTGIVTYLVARRHTSGSIDTTDASTLWGQHQALLNAYVTETDRLRVEVKDARTEAAELRGRVGVLETENRRLSNENLHLAERVAVLEASGG